MPDYNSVTFNDVKLTDIPLKALLDIIKNKNLSGFDYIVTPNTDHFLRLDSQEDEKFKEAYRNATIRICDSRIIQKLSLLEENRIKNVVPGSDLTKHIIESEWAKNLEMLVVGPERRDVEIIASRFGLKKLDYYTPPMGFIKSTIEVEKCIDAIIKSDARIIFLAVGSPQQEILADLVKKHAQGYSPSMMLCIGASFDFLSGKINRAPQIIQKFHLEWLHRALSDPRRLIPRYQKNFRWILSYLTKNIFRKKII